MKRREAAFLLIGLGVGLILGVSVIAEFVLWFHRSFHMFIFGIRWPVASIVLALPLMLVAIGSILLSRNKSERI